MTAVSQAVVGVGRPVTGAAAAREGIGSRNSTTGVVVMVSPHARLAATRRRRRRRLFRFFERVIVVVAAVEVEFFSKEIVERIEGRKAIVVVAVAVAVAILVVVGLELVVVRFLLVALVLLRRSDHTPLDVHDPFRVPSTQRRR